LLEKIKDMDKMILDYKYPFVFLSKADNNREERGGIFKLIYKTFERKSYKLKGFG
jgi:hypothetical protein